MNTDRRAIEVLAYELWAARGSPHGSAHEDWAEAERQLSGPGGSEIPSGVEESLEESFPASDAPASHLPDVPPANAAARWKDAEAVKTVERATPLKAPRAARPKKPSA